MAENFEVRNKEVEEKLQEYGRKMQENMPEGWGFMLMMFSYGENGNLFYMSSADREDMIRAMEEFIARERSKDRA